MHDKFFVHRNAAFGLHVPQGLLLGLEQLQVGTRMLLLACCQFCAAGVLLCLRHIPTCMLRSCSSSRPRDVCAACSAPPRLPQELKLLGCNFKDHAAVLHLPPSVTHVTLLSSDTTSVDFGPHATGLEEGVLLAWAEGAGERGGSAESEEKR